MYHLIKLSARTAFLNLMDDICIKEAIEEIYIGMRRAVLVRQFKEGTQDRIYNYSERKTHRQCRFFRQRIARIYRELFYERLFSQHVDAKK